jgi:23S rRNA pseudoU1915 N3-methylase RlmH
LQSTNQNPDGVVKSRWEDASDERLDKLDAVGTFRKRKRLQSEQEDDNDEEEEELSLLEYLRRRDEKITTGKKTKRVRWADLEAKKEEERQKREVGFCIGGTWGQVTEEEAQAILRGTSPTSGGRD